MTPSARNTAIGRSSDWQGLRWRLLADRLPLFALVWSVILVLWMAVYALEARLVALPAIALVVCQATILWLAIVLARRDPGARRVRVIAVVAGALIGITTTVGFGVMGGSGDAVAFVLLALYLTLALLFAWGWQAELVVFGLTIGPEIAALSIQGMLVSTYMMGGAILLGMIVSLLVAEVSRRSLEAELASRESEARFRGVFDHAPVGMAVASADRRLMQVNRSFCELLGYPEQELLGKSIADITHPEDAPATADALRKLIAGDVQSIAIGKRYVRKDGQVISGRASLSLVRNRSGAPLHFVAQVEDVGERERRQEALRESEGRYRALVESQHDLIARSDPRGRLTFANDAYCRALGLGREHVVQGRVDFPDLVHPDDLGTVMEMQKGLSQPPYRSRVVNRNRTPEGWRWFEWETSSIRDAAGAIVELQAAGRDVTERRAGEEKLRDSLDQLRRSEQKLRALAARQLVIREDERKRLGLDLHDDVCQELVGIGIHLESLRRRLGPMSTENAATFERVSRYLNALVEHLRLLARDLQPLPLRDYGLVDGLRSMVAGLSSETVSVSAVFPTEIPRLEESLEVAIYRFAQEAVINAVRHADASTIDLVVSVEGDMLGLEVRDDGCGFDRDQCQDALGLVSMEERVLALGGKFTLESTPGAGTTVGMTCPGSLSRLARTVSTSGV